MQDSVNTDDHTTNIYTHIISGMFIVYIVNKSLKHALGIIRQGSDENNNLYKKKSLSVKYNQLVVATSYSICNTMNMSFGGFIGNY